MIWSTNCALLACLLAISLSSLVSSGDVESHKLKNQPDENIEEDTEGMPIDIIPENTEDDRDAGPNVGQSLLGQDTVPGRLNLFSLMFPALNSLLLWGNLFSTPSLLGAPPLLGSSQQLSASQSDELPSASKVVLVLAEDRNPHVAMRAANQAAARTIRQNMLGQMVAQVAEYDFAQMLSQSLEKMQLQDPGQYLQQILPQDISQSIGKLLSQTWQPLSSLGLSELPILGQPPTSGEPTVGATQEQSEGQGVASDANQPPPSTSSFQLPNLQSAIEAGAQMLGRAFQPSDTDPNSVYPFSNFQSVFDAGAQVLGQGWQQVNADASSGGFQLPNLQSVIDRGLLNLRPFQPITTDPEPEASQISEVRVKPDVIATAHNPNEKNMRKMENMDEWKMMSALQKAGEHKNLPILWFRIPSDSSEKDHDFETTQKNVDKSQLETKFQTFQRQVIRELKLLQDIERKAKEMRAASKGVTDKMFKDTSNHHTNILTKIPVHKITRADIEKALNDEYVKKLLQKAALANRKGNGKASFQKFYIPNGTQIKRQASTPTETPSPMSREDIVRLMAYAYRMANENGIQMLESSDSKKLAKGMDSDSHKSLDESSKSMEGKWATDSNPPNQMTVMKQMDRQWLDKRMQMPQAQSFAENPTNIDRQMQDKMSPTMGRQRLDEEKTTKTTGDRKFNNEDPKQQQTFPMMEQPRQAMDQIPQMHAQHAIDQRQWVDQKDDTRTWMQENTQVPMQRQWIDTQSQSVPSQTMDVQQPHMRMQQPRMSMQQPQLAMQQPEVIIQQQPQMAMQQPQSDMMMLQQMSPQMQGAEDMLGKATPQIPENAEKARHKDDESYDDFDLFGLGYGQHGKHKGKSKSHGVSVPEIINYFYNFDVPSYGYGGYGDGYSHGSSYGSSYGSGYGVKGGYGYPSGYGSSYGSSYGSGYGAKGGYGYPSGYGSSYGSSYGSGYGVKGGYGYPPDYGSATGGHYSGSGYIAPASSHYRMAVGDDEIRELLQEQNPAKMMTQIDPNHVIAEDVPTAPFLSTIPASDNIHQEHTQSQTVTPTFLKSDKQNPKTTATATPATANMPRLDRKLRLNGILDKGKTFGGDWVRQKRNSNYGTIQTIDANSLNELRKTYKESLKEITLKPDEDPAEALMRYSAASIREALENANQEPMEISMDNPGMSTIDTQMNEPYFNGAQMPVLNQEHASGHAVPQPIIYAHDHHCQHNNLKLVEQSAIAQQQQHLDMHEQAKKILTRNQDRTKILDSNEISAAINDIQQTCSNSKAMYINETQNTISSIPESELKTVFELIKQQMQTCCENCRDRIILGIKANIKEYTRESVQQEIHRQTKNQAPYSRAVNTFELEPKSERDDEQFDRWLREMEAKGYASKYLTKSHHWDYLNSGKLTLALENNAGEPRGDNEITKEINEQQSSKRYTYKNTMVEDAERGNTKSSTSNRSKGKAFAKKIPELNYAIKEDVHVVNDELRRLKDYSEEVTPSTYAMRGKFRNTKVKSRVEPTTDKNPVKFSSMSEQLPADTTKNKVVDLLGLLYDLSPKTESATSKSKKVSVMVMPIVETSTEGPAYATTTSKARTKRMRPRRKQKKQSEIATQPDQSSVGKH